jgi:hypothetical protein
MLLMCDGALINRVVSLELEQLRRDLREESNAHIRDHHSGSFASAEHEHIAPVAEVVIEPEHIEAHAEAEIDASAAVVETAEDAVETAAEAVETAAETIEEAAEATLQNAESAVIAAEIVEEAIEEPIAEHVDETVEQVEAIEPNRAHPLNRRIRIG